MQETSRSIGPYSLLGVLGRGAMGAVHRAEDSRSGRLVALKTVELTSEAHLPTIRREVHALARLRHPGIVRIWDSGSEAGVPWYAMELITGETLQHHCRKLGIGLSRSSPPEPGALRESLTVVRRLCEALAYLHGEGMVHRDLKPENVLVGAAGRPVLVDFGVVAEFAGSLSRETLAVEGSASGTLLYMAPEQVRGELLDARADLYALGCMLYELFAGQPPFQGSAWEVRQAHLERPPVPMSKLVAGTPEGLDELVLRLLCKDPRGRFGYASDIAAALDELGATADPPSDAPVARAYLYRPALAGRQEQILGLLERLTRLEMGTGGLALVGGEMGVGKTRLVMELGRLARGRKLRVLTGECQQPAGAAEGAGGSPLGAFRRLLQAVADRCHDRGRKETERLLGRRGKILALYEPAISSLPGQAEQPEPVALALSASRLRLFNALAETLAALAEDRPLLVILDDLHWADELTLGFLDFLARTRRFDGVPVLLAATYRTEGAGAKQASPLQRLAATSGVLTMALGRMDEAAVGAMVQDMLALSYTPEVFVRFLTRQSEGNPFFVAEYLQTAVAEGVLWRDRLGRWQVAEGEAAGMAPETAQQYEDLPLPRSLQDLVTRRLQSLSPDVLQVLEVASVLGRELGEGMLGAVTGLESDLLLRGLEELLARHVLEEAGPGRLWFVHDRIRQTAYDAIPAPLRRRLHQAAAEAMERQGAAADAAWLGYHWERAVRPEQARDCYLRAARSAAEHNAHEEAERLYRAYAALVDKPNAESLAARIELAQNVLALRGRIAEAVDELRAAVEEARGLQEPGVEARCLSSLASQCRELGLLEETRAYGLEALELSRRIGDRNREGVNLITLGILHGQQGRLAEAREHFLQALECYRDEPEPRTEAMALANLGTVHRRQGELGEAERLFGQALALQRKHGHRLAEGMTLGNIALVCQDQGRLEEARALYEEALAIHRDVGNRAFEALTMSNLAGIDQAQGRFEEARALYEGALPIHREVGDRSYEALTLSKLAEIHCVQGRPWQAHGLYGEALEVARRAADRRNEARILCQRAALERRAVGARTEADRLAQTAVAIFEEIGDRLGAAASLCERGHAALASGRKADAYLEQARGIVEAAALGPKSEVARALDKLERAVGRRRDHGVLFRGECHEDIPPPFFQWMVDSGQLEESFG